MSTHITVDPITRIEGHLRIDVEVDGGVVRKAWSSGQMFRGIERILVILPHPIARLGSRRGCRRNGRRFRCRSANYRAPFVSAACEERHCRDEGEGVFHPV